ncbi:phosphoglycolate phosphatase [Parashewanella curva]|uniref:Phosphoglycolate phosphatase n=1 Tax=Parashewanella curva TaxID=2338552 RepID=A0A3L8PVC1_9GAMM|nr:phosphoglycolate phosphatase [Parashewanella curva]RLV59375.1 phosphoglycolate phosphatase [Parashewanella curva]
MNRRFKAIAFDLDGTLVDSVPDLAAAINGMMMELNLELASEDQVRSWVGNGAEVLVQRAITWSIQRSPESSVLKEALAVFLRHYDLHLNQHSRLYPSVKATLSNLHKQGYQLAIVTNKPQQFIAPLLQAFGLDAYFSLIIGGDTLGRKKPDPLPLNHILQQWQLENSQLLMVGDSKNDILSAKSASIASIGLTYGYNYGEDIGLCGPDAVFDDFHHIENWVNTQF